MVTGSYTQSVSIYKGLPGGKYAAAKRILATNGKPISDESAQSPCFGDWDGDGDYDMVVGFIQGPVKLYLNNGKMAFTERGKLTASGKVISESDGGPCVVDWDGDGMLDLLMGSGEGGVQFYRGKTRGSLDLATGVKVVDAGTHGWQARASDPSGRHPFVPFEPGVRTKPFAADWNDDGKLDLLVGDYISVKPQPRKLIATEQNELKRIDARTKVLEQRSRTTYERVQAKAFRSIGKKPSQRLTAAESRKYSAAFSKLMREDKEYQAFLKEWSQLYARRSRLEPQSEGTGFVWVYLRK